MDESRRDVGIAGGWRVWDGLMVAVVVIPLTMTRSSASSTCWSRQFSIFSNTLEMTKSLGS